MFNMTCADRLSSTINVEEPCMGETQRRHGLVAPLHLLHGSALSNRNLRLSEAVGCTPY